MIVFLVSIAQCLHSDSRCKIQIFLAIEGAIKAAKKYAYDKEQTTDHEIIAMEHSFHGRSLG